MNGAIKALTRFSNALDTPIIRLVGKGFWVALFAIAVYAGKAYLHESIAGDDTTKAIQADLASTKTLVLAHDNFVKAQEATDTRLSDFFKESRVAREDVTAKLAAIIQHGTDLDKRLDRIETKIDK